MDPVSVTSLLSFGKDAIEVIDKIYEFLKAVHEAPKKLRRLLDEVEVLREILSSIANTCDQLRTANEKVSDSVGKCCEKALNFVRNQANCLYTELQKYRTSASTGQWRAWRTSLDMVLRDNRIVEYFNALERGKTLLEIAQANLQMHITTRQARQIDDSAQKLNQSLKLNAAIASYYFLQTRTQAVSHSHTHDSSSMAESRTRTLPERNQYNAQNFSSSMRQDLAELRSAASSMTAPPLSQTHIEPQLLLQTVLAQAVDDRLRQEPRSTPELNNGAHYSNMPSEDRYHDRTQLRSSQRISYMFTTQQQQYSQSQVSYNNAISLSSWLGTVTITRKIRASQSLHRRDEESKPEKLSQTTAIQFTPAPWLTNTAYVLSLQKELIYTTSSHIGLALQPVRYTQVPLAAFRGIRLGDFASLQQMLAAGQLSLHDRIVMKGRALSLLELSIDAISWVWLFNEGAVFSDRRVHILDVIHTARWIFSRGTSADTQCQDVILPTSWDFCHMRGSYSSEEIEQMEQLLIEVTENESPVSRCQRLLSFAMANPEHSLYVDCVISDIAAEDYTDEEILSVAAAEEQYWAKGSILDQGQETVIFHALIRLKRELRQRNRGPIPQAIIRECLKGPRRLLVEMLKVALDVSNLDGAERAQTIRDVVDYVSSLLRVCRDLPILEDGFGDLMSAYAYEHQIRDIWNAIMSDSTGYSDGIDPEMIRLDLDTSISLFIRRDSERRVINFEDIRTEAKGSLDTCTSPLGYLWALVILFLRSII